MQMDERDSDAGPAEDSADSTSAVGLRVRHLPPLCLRLRFPGSYPASTRPEFSLSALWLGADDNAALAAQLERLWEEQVLHRVVALARVTCIDLYTTNSIKYECMGVRQACVHGLRRV
jgi:RWD domain